MKALRQWPYAVLYALLLVLMCAYLWKVPQGISNSDTGEYLSAWQTISGGHPDVERTPVYPLIFGGLCALFGAKAGTVAVIILQWCLLFVAVYYFRLEAAMLLRSPKAVFWTTAVFALTPNVYLYGSVLLTEGFAISAVVFMTFCFLKSTGAPPKKSVWYMLAAMAWLMFLIYLRPIFVYMIPAAAFFLAVLYMRRRSKAMSCVRSGAIALLAITVSIAVYIAANSRSNGVACFSYISTINNYCGLRHAGMIEVEKVCDPDVRRALVLSLNDSARRNAPDSGAVVYNDIQEAKRATALCGHRKFKNYVDSVMLHRPLDCISKIIGYRIDDRIEDYPAVNIMPMCLDIVQIPLPRPFMKDVLMLLMLYLCTGLYIMRKKRQWNVHQLIVLLIPLGLLCVSIVGSMDEYGRLFVPAYSCFVLATAVFLESLALSRKELKWLK